MPSACAACRKHQYERDSYHLLTAEDGSTAQCRKPSPLQLKRQLTRETKTHQSINLRGIAARKSRNFTTESYCSKRYITNDVTGSVTCVVQFAHDRWRAGLTLGRVLSVNDTTGCASLFCRPYSVDARSLVSENNALDLLRRLAACQPLPAMRIVSICALHLAAFDVF